MEVSLWAWSHQYAFAFAGVIIVGEGDPTILDQKGQGEDVLHGLGEALGVEHELGESDAAVVIQL